MSILKRGFTIFLTAIMVGANVHNVALVSLAAEENENKVLQTDITLDEMSQTDLTFDDDSQDSIAEDRLSYGNLYYVVNENENEVTITGFVEDSFNDTSIVIPEIIDEKIVTSIGEYAFEGCSSLTDIVIPESVTSIGRRAFKNCGSLTSVNIPESVTKMGDGVFMDCSGLVSAGVTGSGSNIQFAWKDKIIDSAFRDCNSLVNIQIPESVTNIGWYAFEECSSLVNIDIPDNVTIVGAYAFKNCSSLENVNMSESVVSIGKRAFEGCASLMNIEIPKSVTSIGEYAFKGCGNLTSAGVIGSGNSIEFGWETTIPQNAFKGCSSLERVDIPKSVISIGGYAFEECSNLKSIDLPDGITIIGWSVFRGCSSLENITIPDSVTNIGESAFRECSSLTNVIIPECVTYMGYYAFSYCSNLVSIKIPESVKTIEKDTFTGCKYVTIYGYEESYAKNYAVKNNIPFRNIKEAAHEHEYIFIIDREPTCIEGGMQHKECTICGEKIDVEEIPVTENHKWDTWQRESEATVFAPEKQYRKCSLCKKKETRSYGSKLKATMKLTASSLTLKVKQSTTALKVSGMANGDYLKSVTSSSTKRVKVSSVSKKGTFKLTAQNTSGTATITVKLASGLSKKITVKVQKSSVLATGISGLPKSVAIDPGKKYTLKAKVSPITCVSKITYSSSNRKIATVSSSGVIKGVKSGKAKITVRADKKAVTVFVTVNTIKATKITNVESSLTLKVKKTAQLAPKLYPTGASDKITYTSSNTKVATVTSKGKITAKKKGTAYITIKAGKTSFKCKVTVK